MDIKDAQLTMPEDEAKELWEEYRQLLEDRKAKKIEENRKYLEDITLTLSHLKRGHVIIDIYKAISRGGIFGSEGTPRLAIARADWHECIFEKHNPGYGQYYCRNKNRKDWRSASIISGTIILPRNTFPQWQLKPENERQRFDNNILNREIYATIPRIPYNLMPNGKLSNYYILWEVEKWTNIPAPEPPRDPILLRRITDNLAVVLGTWELTELEKSILQGVK